MAERIPLVVALALVACSSSSPASTGGSTFDAGEAGTPDASIEPSFDGGTEATPGATLGVSPACGAVGTKTVFKLAKNGVSPTCVRTADFAVQFAGAALVQPDEASLGTDGYCVLSMTVPAKATSGRVVVKTAGDVYLTDASFDVPCP